MGKDNLQQITQETKMWKPGLDILLPIDTGQIPGFVKWVNLRGYSKDHKGYDFFAYKDTEGSTNYHLQPATKVRAIADGIVKAVIPNIDPLEFIRIEHGMEGSGLWSWYGHVIPQVVEGQYVKKGELIGTLCNNPQHIRGYGIHLHFVLHHFFEDRIYSVDPAKIYPNLS